MKKILFAVSLLLATGLWMSLMINAGEKSIALAVKVIREVSRKTETIDWTTAKKGELIYSGDHVRTGDRSIAIVKFTDNSILRVREKSELEILGEQKDGGLEKNVHLTRGEFSFDIQKQENEKFIFTSPTSVAAIRGTRGTMVRLDSGDVVVVIEGLVNLLNSISNTGVDVGPGQTGISYTDGRVFVRDATSNETTNAQRSVNAGNGGGRENLLDIELKDDQNNKKRLRIRYKD
ncbi:MAG: FecR domain-containing protein [Ignavibacteriales bacterium]|nr:FecR domain-containing protein [Ignavibacteriales bacterium]